MMEFVNWDDEIPNCFWKVIQNSMVPNHQPVYIYIYIYSTHIPLNPIKSSFLLVKSLSIVFTTRKPGGSGRLNPIKSTISCLCFVQISNWSASGLFFRTAVCRAKPPCTLSWPPCCYRPGASGVQRWIFVAHVEHQNGDLMRFEWWFHGI